MGPTHNTSTTTTNTELASNPTRFLPPRGYALSGKIMLSAIVVLFTVVLLILFVHLYVRWHVYRRRSLLRRRRQSHLQALAAAAAAAPPRGLDPKVLKSLGVLVYCKKDCAAAAAECAVCLSEFEEGEEVRVLPRCDHRFHTDCIDEWFGAHNSCPLCRAPVEMEAIPSDLPKMDRECAAAVTGSSSESAADGEMRIEIGDEADRRRGAGIAGSRLGFWGIKRYLLGGDERPRSRQDGDVERGAAVESDLPATAAEP